MSDRVIVTIADGIADVRFNRADKRNALDGEQFAAIEQAGEQLKSAEGVRVVVLSGEGESFCAGLDFAMFSGMAGAERPTDRAGNPGDIPDGRITHRGQQICWVWQELPMPVIAAVHGHALGGGFQIAMGADIRIAHPETKWSVREVHWGLVPDMTGTFMLNRLVRSDIARELTYTARMVDGREAYELGLVTRLSDNPYDDAMALAREIAGRSPGAVRGSKALFNRMFVEGAAEQFAEERRLIGEQIGSPNQIEAIMSNMERRVPNFTD
jgi:enoyl-CoA hydratase/carnithine racemase